MFITFCWFVSLLPFAGVLPTSHETPNTLVICYTYWSQLKTLHANSLLIPHLHLNPNLLLLFHSLFLSDVASHGYLYSTLFRSKSQPENERLNQEVREPKVKKQIHIKSNIYKLLVVRQSIHSLLHSYMQSALVSKTTTKTNVFRFRP